MARRRDPRRGDRWLRRGGRRGRSRSGPGFVVCRASGNEPGWYLELSRGDSLHLEYDYGERQLTVATPEPVVDSAGDRRLIRFETSDSALRVTIGDESCVAMSGTEFPTTVVVDVGGTSYRGCGRWLDGRP